MAEESKEVIFQKLRRVVSDQMGVAESEITLTSNFDNDLGADSLDTIELVMAMEEEFEIELPDEEADKVRTVQEAVDLLHSKLK